MEVNDFLCVVHECVFQGISERAAVPIKALIKLSGSRICAVGFLFPRRIFFSLL